jgi:hypothetical protein
MGLFGFVGGVVGRVVGVDAIKSGGALVKRFGTDITSTPCPKCLHGRLSRVEVTLDSTVEVVRACGACDYFEPLSGPGEQELALLQADARRRLSELQPSDLEQIQRGHRRSARVFFVMALGMVLYALYTLLWTDRAGLLLPLGGFGVLFLAQGLKSSFRHWQIESGTLFQPGAFKRWVRQGQWVI